MKIQKNTLMLTAAFTGLLAGTMTRLSPAPTASGDSSAMISSVGPLATQFAAKDDKKADKKAGKDTNSCGVRAAAGPKVPKKTRRNNISFGWVAVAMVPRQQLSEPAPTFGA